MYDTRACRCLSADDGTMARRPTLKNKQKPLLLRFWGLREHEKKKLVLSCYFPVKRMTHDETIETRFAQVFQVRFVPGFSFKLFKKDQMSVPESTFRLHMEKEFLITHDSTNDHLLRIHSSREYTKLRLHLTP